MVNQQRIATGLLIVLVIQSFTHSADAVTIDMVTVGNPGNAPDTRYSATGFGSVGYNYQIGKYEVTAGQYTEFLNAVADADPNGLYDTNMGSSPGANIQRAGSSPNYSYSVAADWADRPVNYVSFWDAARFANWLHNGQPTGAQGPGTTEGGTYHDVGNQTLFGRSAGARFFIPTEDEWYKAAYHKNDGVTANYWDYPTASDAAPINTLPDPGNHANFQDYYGTGNDTYTIGSPYYRTEVGEFANSVSPYGTFDQGGNVSEWNETKVTNSSRGRRGGGLFNASGVLQASIREDFGPPFAGGDMGFRVASSIPEPSTLLLLCFGSLAVLWRRRLVRASILAAVVCISFTDCAEAVTIDTVPVGNPGNAGDVHSNGTFGAVPYAYRIGKTEVTNSQYVEYLNGVDPTGANTLALYNTNMSSDAKGGINFNGGAANGSKYEIKLGRDNNPVVFVSWYDSIRFVNWLHNDQGSGNTEDGAYTLLGGTPTPSNGNSITRNAGIKWWLPSEDEWYKAAYHKNDGVTGNYWDYPTSTDAVPFSDQPPGTGAPDSSNTANFFNDDGSANGYNDGYAVGSPNYLTDVGAYTLSLSPHGTFDQGGNVWEWNDTIITSSPRVLRGGSWSSFSGELPASHRFDSAPAFQVYDIGFRVASIPEPSTLLLVCFGSLAVLGIRKGR